MLPSRGLLFRPGRNLRLPRGAEPRLTTALGGGVGGQAGRTRAFGSSRAAATALLRSKSSQAVTAAPSASLLLASRGPRVMTGVVGRGGGRSPVGSVAAFSLFPWRSKKPDLPAQLESAKPDAAATAPSSSSSSDFSFDATTATTTTTPPSSLSSPSSSSSSSIAVDTDFYSAPVTDPAAEVADLLDGAALLDLPEQIGYLKALGLDFGWGPSSLCQSFLEHIHIYTGLPWWSSIVAAAVLFRLAIFFPSLTAAEQSAKMQKLRQDPEFTTALAEMQAAASRGGGSNRVLELRMKTRRMQQQAGISTWKMLIPMVNIPFAYGMYRLLRSMASLPVPGWDQAGILWFTDLSMPDPYFALPLASAGIMYIIFMNNIKYMAPEQAKMMKVFQMVVTPMSIIFTAKMSAGVTLLFFITSLTQLIQTILWHQPWLRRWKGMPPVHTLIHGGNGGLNGAAQPIFRLDPNSSWQAPRTIATTAKTRAPGQPPAPPTTVDIVKEGWDKMIGSAKDKQGASADKANLQKAIDYDRRRAAEDDEALIQRREAERQYRAMKKTLAKAEAAAAASATDRKTLAATSSKKAPANNKQ